MVVDRHKCAHVGADGVEGFADLEGLSAAVLVDEAEAGVANFAAEGVAQHDQLDQRKDHRRQHQCG